MRGLLIFASESAIGRSVRAERESAVERDAARVAGRCRRSRRAPTRSVHPSNTRSPRISARADGCDIAYFAAAMMPLLRSAVT
jgi:hypothetical protein